jgi:YgiT-type zinc finger domain-containing protein
MPIKTCPTCGHRRIGRKRTTLTLKVRGRTFRVPDIELEVCPDCGEKLFDLQASRQVEQAVYGTGQRRKRTAA